MKKVIGRSFCVSVKVLRRVLMWIQRPLFKRCGKNVSFGHGCDFSYENIEIGDDVYIGPHACFMSAISTIRIGSKVLFGPNVTIMGGDHRTNVVGSYMYDVHEKLPENDVDVTIEDDVWVGSNVLILKGVRIGRGSIVGGGSVVTKDVPPYSIYLGQPELKLRPRWDAATIAEHERLLKSRSKS
jgi:acetyltransferase-like isoleucine patch superfamily enzyme